MITYRFCPHQILKLANLNCPNRWNKSLIWEAIFSGLFSCTETVAVGLSASAFENFDKKWAASWQNQQCGMCAQRRLRSAWASAQSDQSLRCLHEEGLGLYLPIEWTAKTLIRLGGCPGWSKSSLGAHPLCWFCHEAAQITQLLCLYKCYIIVYNVFYVILVAFSFMKLQNMGLKDTLHVFFYTYF